MELTKKEIKAIINFNEPAEHSTPLHFYTRWNDLSPEMRFSLLRDSWFKRSCRFLMKYASRRMKK